MGQRKEVNVAEAVKDVGKGKEVKGAKKVGCALVRGMRTRVELASWVVVFTVSGLTQDKEAILKLSTVRQSQLDELNKELFNCEAQYKQGVAKPRSSMRCLMKLAPKARNPLWKVEPKHKKSVISEGRGSPETRF